MLKKSKQNKTNNKREKNRMYIKDYSKLESVRVHYLMTWTRV